MFPHKRALSLDLQIWLLNLARKVIRKKQKPAFTAHAAGLYMYIYSIYTFSFPPSLNTAVMGEHIHLAHDHLFLQCKKVGNKHSMEGI